MSSHAIIKGGLYAERLRDGPGYMITKVLAVDFAVHIRIYAENFVKLPEKIDSSQLTVAVGHAPMSLEGWSVSHVLVGREEVGEDELEGYRCYMGG